MMKEYVKKLYWQYKFDTVLEELIKKSEEVDISTILEEYDARDARDYTTNCLSCIMKLKIE